MDTKKENWLQKHKMGVFVGVSAVLMLIGLSYAWLQLTLRGTKELTILTAGSLELELDDTMAGGISFLDAVPISNEDGLAQEGYTFTLENKGNVTSDYTIYLDDLDLAEGQNRMSDSFIKYQLVKDGSEVDLQLLDKIGTAPNRVLESGTIAPKTKYTYVLKMWIDENATNEVMQTMFKGQLRIEAMQAMKTAESATKVLASKTNDVSVTYEAATEAQKKEMFTIENGGAFDYRYRGTEPNNYVTFNDEVWRIIGVFNGHLKMIRNDSIGQYGYDNSVQNGSNVWESSQLKTLLNSGSYYNRTYGADCPGETVGETASCTFASTGLGSVAKSMIESTSWDLGSITEANYATMTAGDFYEAERVHSGSSTWTGEVGLMYSSDYGFSSGDSSCLSTPLKDYGTSCQGSSWLSVMSGWTITPVGGDNSKMFYLSGGNILTSQAYYSRIDIHPVVYLKTDVKILSGDGSSTDPYKLTL